MTADGSEKCLEVGLRELVEACFFLERGVHERGRE